MEKTIRELDQTEIDAVSGGTWGDYSEYGYGWWDSLYWPWTDVNSSGSAPVAP